jgi:hypothetical protein
VKNTIDFCHNKVDISNRKGRSDGPWHFVFVLVVLRVAGVPTSVDEDKPW